jgi:hypothetical protein
MLSVNLNKCLKKKDIMSGGNIQRPFRFHFSIRNVILRLRHLTTVRMGCVFKSNFFLKPGTIVFIRLKKSNLNSVHNVLSKGLRSATLAEVKWCKEIQEINVAAYGVGVRYFAPVY